MLALIYAARKLSKAVLATEKVMLPKCFSFNYRGNLSAQHVNLSGLLFKVVNGLIFWKAV